MRTDKPTQMQYDLPLLPSGGVGNNYSPQYMTDDNNSHLEVHEVHELLDLWREDFHCLLIDFYPVLLFIRLDLRHGRITFESSYMNQKYS